MPIEATQRGGQPLVAPKKSQRRNVLALMPVACAVLCMLAAASARAEQKNRAPTNFDVETLKARGIDPALVEFFKHSPRFTQGARNVSLVVNGQKMGNVEAQFDADGNLCIDDALLAKARLRTPGDAHVLPGAQGSVGKCYDFKAAFPQTEITLRPNREEVAILVSQDALAGDTAQSMNFTKGGFAALANYDVMGLRSSASHGTQDYLSASTLVGFNLGDWVVRSRQIYTKNGDVSNFDHLYTYAQRTFVDHKSVLQAGQINISSPLFGGAPITGVQIQPEGALNGTSHSMALVEGIAQSQATVEVRQAGMLIFSTLVPEGPFALTDIPLLNTNTDLNVTVREVGGAERHFTVSAASFRLSAPAAPGYTFAAGKVRSVGGSGAEEPWVVTGTGTWTLNRDATATAGAMASSRYQSVGMGGDATLGGNVGVSVRSVISNELGEGVRGAQASAAVTVPLTQSLSASVSRTQQTSGYRDLSDSLRVRGSDSSLNRSNSQSTASVSWSNETLGALNLAYATGKSGNGYTSERVVGSWGKSFKDFSVSASLETSLGASGGGSAGRGYAGRGNDRAAYLSVSIPLGKRYVQGVTRVRDNAVTTGAAMSEVVNDQLNYRVSAERNNNTGATYASGNVSVLPRYTSVDLGYSQGSSVQSYSGRLSGGVVAHKSGVTFSPYEVQDTFGIVELPDVSGAKLTTPYGPVWTDFSGKAVVPMLSPYRNSRVEVDTKTLPRRVDLNNGFKNLEAGRGSVNHLTFDVVSARRYLVTAVDASGQPLPKGASVLGESGNYVTTVLDKGTVFLSDTAPGTSLKVSLPGSETCKLEINFPKEEDKDAFYDVATAVCV